MKIQIQGIGDIRLAARQFISHIGNRRVFAFYGAMGAGKTTFIKAICEELGVTEQVTSPTFAIVNVYEGNELPTSPTPQSIYHFDFYRIKRLEEAYDMGCEEYFYSGSLCFIEWPEMIEPILPGDAVRVTITQQGDSGARMVAFDEPAPSC